MRFRGIASLAVTALCVAAVPAVAAPRDSQPPETPCYAGNPGAETQLLGVGSTGVRWAVTLTQGADNPNSNASVGLNLTEPVVSGGVAYVGMQGQLLAVRTSDGVTLWSVPLTANPQQVLLDGSHVILVSSSGVAAYLRSTGEAVWSRSVSGSIIGPTAVTGRHGLALSDSRGRTEVVNLADGKVRWRSSTHGGTDPVIADPTTVVRVDPSYLEAFDAKTGRRLWQVAGSYPVLTHGIVVAILSKPYEIAGLNVRTGKLLWHSKTFVQPLAAGDGGVLANSATQVVFLDPRTGRRLWSAHGQVQRNSLQVSFAKGVVADVENTANRNEAVGHRVSDGKAVWHAPQSNGGGFGSSGVQGTTALVATGVNDTAGTGSVTRYDTRTGKAAWTATTPYLPQGLAVSDGTNAVVLDEPPQCGTGTTAVTAAPA